MVKEKWYKNPEMIIALTALFIGLLTAFISIYSAYTDRAYAKASVWPKIEIFRSHNVRERAQRSSSTQKFIRVRNF